MIRRELRLESGPAWLLIPQPEHARLARDLAAQWKTGPWLPLEPADEMLAAIEHHDDGWLGPDNHREVDPELGHPRDFLETPLASALEIWTGSVQAARSHGWLAGYVVARHFQRLLAQRTATPQVRASLASAGGAQSSETLAENYRRLLAGTNDPEAGWLLANHPMFGPANPAAGWLAEWLAFQPGRTAERAEQAVDQLQLFDWLSLWLCMAERDTPHTLSPPGGPPVTLTPLPMAQATEDGTPRKGILIEAAPWPFRAAEVVVSAIGWMLPQQRDGEPAAAGAKPCTMSWHFVPGPTEQAWRKRLAGVSCEPVVEHYPLLTSTNDRARQLAEGPLPALVVADQQTAGRGRGANVWWTGEGSLAISLVVDLGEWQVSGREGPLASLAAGVALVDLLAPRMPGVLVGLHWPNDVYVNAGPGERKIAGILIEGLTGGKVVVGVGLNVNNTLAQAPAEVQSIAATLADLTGRPHDRLDLAAEFVEAFTALLAELGRDPGAIVERADKLCLQHGRTLTIETPREQTTGVCRGLAPDGALVLETPDGMRSFHGGVLRRS